MRYTLLILTPPDAGSSPRHALDFARTAISAGHEILCVFFYDAGVLTAASGREAPQDEDDLCCGWQELARDTGTPLFACVASAARFGVGSGVGSRTGAATLRDHFSIAGLGELVDANHRADRLMTFAG